MCGEGGGDVGGGWVKKEVVVGGKVGGKMDRCDEVAFYVGSTSAICQATWDNFGIVEGVNGRGLVLHKFYDVGDCCGPKV